MVRLVKVAERLLIVAGVGAFVWLLYVQLRYWAVMPEHPDPVTGRVYAYNAMRFRVYVTAREAELGRLAEVIGPLGISAAAAGALLLRRAKERLARGHKDKA